MSYETKQTIHPFIHVYRDAPLTDNASNYREAYDEDGFPYDIVDNSGGGLSYNFASDSISINAKGLYLISYSYNVRNNDNNTGGDTIEFGVSINTPPSTSLVKYYSEVDTEGYSAALRYVISNSIFVSCNAGDMIKGYVNGSSTSHDFVTSNRGSTSLSIGLIAPYS